MLKPLTLAILMAVAPSTQAASYDFSGTLEDHFEHLWSSPAPSTVLQTGGALTFHTQGVALDSTAELFVYRLLQPTYQQSWTAQLQVGVPASLDNQTRTGNGEFYVGASLIAFTTDLTGEPNKVMSIDLESSPPHGHLYWAGYATISSGTEDDMAYQLTGDVSGIIGLSFDAASKVLSAYNAYGLLLSVDIDDPASNWGMQGSDPFFLAIGFDSDGMSVAENEPLRIDDFSLTLQPVPEPETYALMLAGLGLVGFAARRRTT